MRNSQQSAVQEPRVWDSIAGAYAKVLRQGKQQDNWKEERETRQGVLAFLEKVSF